MKQLEIFKVAHYMHGTVYRYKKRGCRCSECRKAATAYRNASSGFKCLRCGRPAQKSGSVCHPCRREKREHRPQTKTTWVCETCGVQVYRWKPNAKETNRFCSISCAGIASRKDPDTLADPYSRRASKAPGLTAYRRNKLLKRWQRQGRACYYCLGPCESVDHVVPIELGGTNFEGNLVPCCRRCNGSKSDRLLVEWRLHRGITQAA